MAAHVITEFVFRLYVHQILLLMKVKALRIVNLIELMAAFAQILVHFARLLYVINVLILRLRIA